MRSSQEGLYIATWSHGVEEYGVFVPRGGERFSPLPGTDPEYRPLSSGVFSYHIRG